MAVEFNNESQEQRAAQLYAQVQAQTTTGGTGMEQWLINKGVAKTQQQAKLVLIVLVVVFLIASAGIFYSSTSPSSVSEDVELRGADAAQRAGL